MSVCVCCICVKRKIGFSSVACLCIIGRGRVGCVCVCVCVEVGRFSCGSGSVWGSGSAAARLGLFDGSRRTADVDAAADVRRRRGRTHAVLDFGCHRHEGLLDVGGVLGRRLQEGNVQLFGVFLMIKHQSNHIYMYLFGYISYEI